MALKTGKLTLRFVFKKKELTESQILNMLLEGGYEEYKWKFDLYRRENDWILDYNV
jgi:hypothetical protein